MVKQCQRGLEDLKDLNGRKSFEDLKDLDCAGKHSDTRNVE